MKLPLLSRSIATRPRPFFHPFWPLCGPNGALQTHACLRPLQKSASGHPDIAQRKQRDELCGVFLEPAVAHLGVPKPALDDSKRMLVLGPDTGIELFHFFRHRAPRRVLLRLSAVPVAGLLANLRRWPQLVCWHLGNPRQRRRPTLARAAVSTWPC